MIILVILFLIFGGGRALNSLLGSRASAAEAVYAEVILEARRMELVERQFWLQPT